MNNLAEYREIESLCRQRAISDRARNWKWLGEADRWSDLAHREIASRFQKQPDAPWPNGHGATHALAPLVRDGLVELMQDSLDARMKHALLTSKGRARLGKAVKHWAVANRHVEKVMGSAKTAKLRELADQVSTETFRSVRRA